MSKSSSRILTIASLSLLLAACTNGGKNLRDTTGMSPGSAGGQLGAGGTPGVAPGAATGATTGATPAATADSLTSRRDTLGGRMRGMMPRTRRDSMHRMMGDTTRRRP